MCTTISDENTCKTTTTTTTTAAPVTIESANITQQVDDFLGLFGLTRDEVDEGTLNLLIQLLQSESSIDKAWWYEHMLRSFLTWNF